MKRVFEHAMIFDGSGSLPFPGEVRVEGQRITAVAKGKGKIPRNGAEVVDCEGATLMPGLCEPHAHITYPDMLKLRELGDTPPEEHVFITMHNAHKMMDAGFTSLYSAASSKPRTEVVVRNEIESGRIKGPRFRAASPEIVSTGGLGDERQMHMYHQGIELIADGVDEVTRTVRMCIREGVDTIKVNISGDNFVRVGQDGACTYTAAEVKAAADEAHERGVWLSCHSRADAAVRLALDNRFRVLYHCEHASDATIERIASARDTVFLAPAIGANYRLAHHAQEWGITKEVAESMRLFQTIELTAMAYQKMRKAGIPVLPGGDYGFIWNPIGTNARDFAYFVELFGYTPAETLSAATMLGGKIMNMPDLGLVKEGFLADLLLVDGDPVKDVRILEDKENLLMIMKDGEDWKSPRPRRKHASVVREAELGMAK